MNITIPPEIQIAGIIVAVICVAVAGGWIYLKSRGGE